MYLRLNSDIIPRDKPTSDNIISISQFFIHADPARYQEIQYCLFANCINPNVHRIILLNERIYTTKELGLINPCSKIEQIIIGKRLMYSDVIQQVNSMNLSGYIVLHNSDIFFDETLANILLTDCSIKPALYAQLRWEFNGFKDIKIFGPRADSQDVWIWHSNFNNILLRNKKCFVFELGQAGCDNSLIYLFKIFGFRIVNDPVFIHCFHYHQTQIRNYIEKNRIPSPYAVITFPETPLTPDICIDDHNLIYEYILRKGSEPFIIPRLGCIEATTAYEPGHANIPTMKNNAGIKITSLESVNKWANKYYDSFRSSEIYLAWSTLFEDNCYKYIHAGQDYLVNNITETKKKIWAHCLDVFEQIERRPWTLALRGKRILLITAFQESIKKQLTKPYAYGIDLFPECSFVYLRPPQTNANMPSWEWDIELDRFYVKLDAIKDDYDIALVSAGGYGNIMCDYIFKHGKQSIYVGGVLQMYFGLYGGRWLIERPRILTNYLNEHWCRPSEDERPDGFKNIENGCYY